MLSKRQYELATGRRQKSDVIAYQIRQSFKPGEITAEEANKVGYELAMRFTKGKYMSRYEYGVLSLMARHPGQLFTKEQIFEAVWHQDSESCLTAVTNAIGRIRQKIEDDRAAPVYIRTISNLGYQFMPTVSAESVEKDS